MNNFFENQNSTQKELYIELLKITGSLSNLFAESRTPFIYYRAMENIFCKAFNADNLSRSDISADAGKNRLGIGLKTFLQNNGKTFQKVAEFNRESYMFESLKDLELIQIVSEMRNERISSTMRMCDLDNMIYHLLTRSEGKMTLFEENMDLINLNNIEILPGGTKSTVHFTDGIHEYNFNKSKSTLLKRFNTESDKKIFEFDVEILEDPFEFLLKINSNSKKSKLIGDTEILKVAEREINEIAYISNNKEIIDYIVLPLYSLRDGQVPSKSGLNQWNAGGRKRDPDEVYISVPAWIHKKKKEFFKEFYNTSDNKTRSFEVVLPNKKELAMKIAQAGGKALMSNPNKDLGKWILREILKLPSGVVVTKNMLNIIGIDSIKLSKLNNGKFALDFLKTGSYEAFEEKFR